MAADDDADKDMREMNAQQLATVANREYLDHENPICAISQAPAPESPFLPYGLFRSSTPSSSISSSLPS